MFETVSEVGHSRTDVLDVVGHSLDAEVNLDMADLDVTVPAANR